MNEDSENTRNQGERILDHLKNIGPLTSIDALQLYGSFRLAARIHALRKQLEEDGYEIITERIKHPHKRGCKYAKYSLVSRYGQQLQMRL